MATQFPDISSALQSFQQAFSDGHIDVRPCKLDGKLFLHVDRPTVDDMRLTYVRLQGKTVTSMVQMLRAEPVEGLPCVSVAWAVPPEFRGEKRAGETFLAALREFRHGFAQSGPKSFYVEGVAKVDNIPSRRTAEKVFLSPGMEGIDKEANVPIFQYLRRIDPATEI